MTPVTSQLCDPTTVLCQCNWRLSAQLLQWWVIALPWITLTPCSRRVILCVQPLAYANIPFKPYYKQKIVTRSANKDARKEKEAVVQYQLRSTSLVTRKLQELVHFMFFPAYKMTHCFFTLHLNWGLRCSISFIRGEITRDWGVGVARIINVNHCDHSWTAKWTALM